MDLYSLQSLESCMYMQPLGKKIMSAIIKPPLERGGKGDYSTERRALSAS